MREQNYHKAHPASRCASPLAGLGVATVLFVQTTAVLAQSNLVPNPAFLPGPECEGTWTGNCARGFYGAIHSDGASMFVQLEEADHILLFRLEEPVEDTVHASARWSTESIIPGATYEVSVSHRAREWRAGSEIQATLFDADTVITKGVQNAPASSTVWTRVGMLVTVPDEAERLEISLEIHGACDETPCGDVSFDDLKVVQHSGTSGFTEAPYRNLCPDGQFLNLSSRVCLPLETTRGFDPQAFEAAVNTDRVRTVSECTEAELRDAIRYLKNKPGGGTLRIPACTIQVAERVDLPSNLLLVGAGVGRSIITAEDGCEYEAEKDPKVLHIFKQQHVVIRDLTISARTCAEGPLDAVFSHNVLLDRVELSYARLNGLAVSFSRGVTVRYSTAHHTVQNNGILSKDCFLRSPETFMTEDQCINRTLSAGSGNVGPGSLFTENYAVYSTHAFDNEQAHGLALHATFGEIAGNLIEGNERGMKMPDARQVMVHHNRMQNNHLWGIQIYSPIIDRPPQNITLARNQFILNGHLAARFKGAKGIYLAQNLYESNNQCYGNCWQALDKGENGLLIKPNDFENGVTIESDVYRCADTQDATLPVFGGGEAKEISGGLCDGLGDNVTPVAVDDTVSVYAGAPTSLLVTANDSDADGDAVLVSNILEPPEHGTARRDGNSVVYTATAGYFGTDAFTYEIADAFGATDEATVTITVEPAPTNSPVAVSDADTVVTGTDSSIEVLENDYDPSGVSISLTGIPVPPLHGEAWINDDWIMYRSDEAYTGADRVTYEITNVFGKTDTAGVAVTVVVQPNRNPKARTDSVTTTMNTWTEIDVLANDEDPDGDSLRVHGVVRVALNGVAVPTDSAKRITYIPDDNFAGADAFRYAVVDGRGGYSEAIVYVEVINANEAKPEIPDEDLLVHPVYPNPARQSTTGTFSLGKPAELEIALFDLLGKQVRLVDSGRWKTGNHWVRFDVGRLPAGLYFLRFRTDTRIHAQPVEVVR